MISGNRFSNLYHSGLQPLKYKNSANVISWIYLFPSETRMATFYLICSQTVFRRHLVPPGVAKRNPGLSKFNPFGVRSEQIQMCYQKCKNCTLRHSSSQSSPSSQSLHHFPSLCHSLNTLIIHILQSNSSSKLLVPSFRMKGNEN